MLNDREELVRLVEEGSFSEKESNEMVRILFQFDHSEKVKLVVSLARMDVDVYKSLMYLRCNVNPNIGSNIEGVQTYFTDVIEVFNAKKVKLVLQGDDSLFSEWKWFMVDAFSLYAIYYVNHFKQALETGRKVV